MIMVMGDGEWCVCVWNVIKSVDNSIYYDPDPILGSKCLWPTNESLFRVANWCWCAIYFESEWKKIKRVPSMENWIAKK